MKYIIRAKYCCKTTIKEMSHFYCIMTATILLLAQANLNAYSQNITDRILTVWLSDHSTVKLRITTYPEITFVDGSVSISTIEKTISFQNEDVLKLTYDNDVNNINSLTRGKEVIFEKTKIIINTTSSPISLYNINGIKIPAISIIESGRTIIPIGTLSSGIYILRIGKNSYKFEIH